MRHISKFDEWQLNEVSMSDLFKSIHGAIDEKDLVKLKDLVGKDKFPTKGEFDATVEYLGVDPDKIFYNKNSIIGPYVYWDGPLFYEFPAGLDMKAMEMFRTKDAIAYFQSKMDRMLKSKDYVTVFSIIDKKILFPMFIKMYDEIPDSQKYNVFIDLYVRSEYGFETLPHKLIRDVFSKREMSAKWKKRMTDFGRKARTNEDGTVTIYRGENTRSTRQDAAYSWTLSRKTAVFFANRFSKGTGKIVKIDVDPSVVLDYLEDRGEAEVLIFPKNIDE